MKATADHYTLEILAAFATRSLEDAEMEQCQSHLIGCTDCREALTELARVLYSGISEEDAAVIEHAARLVKAPILPEQDVPAFQHHSRTRDTRRILSLAASIFLVILFGFYRAHTNLVVPVSAPRPFEARISTETYSEFVRTKASVTRNASANEDSALAEAGMGDLQLGRFFLLGQRLDKARTYLGREAEHHPDSAVWNDLGVAYLEGGGDTGARQGLQAFQKSLAIDPHFPPALFNAGLACERLGRQPDAEYDWRLFLQIDPDSGWAREVRAKLASSTNR